MKTKLTIAETITKLEDGFGSIYSKDDVLLMLNNLELNETKVESSITKSHLRILKNAIVETINKNREDICTIDDIELSINLQPSWLYISIVALFIALCQRFTEYEAFLAYCYQIVIIDTNPCPIRLIVY
jgi:hypothetical protein